MLRFPREPEYLWREIRNAEQKRNAHIHILEDMVQEYVGGFHYSREMEPTQWPENHYGEFLRLTTSRVVHNNPRWRVKSRRPAVQGEISQMFQLALNRWTHDVHLRKFLKDQYRTGCFMWAPSIISSDRMPWMHTQHKEPVYWPTVASIEPKDFYFDPVATTYQVSRFRGHRYRIDKDDLLERAKTEEGWEESAIRHTAEDVTQPDEEGIADSGVDDIDRKQVLVYETWVPEIHTGDPDEGYNGTIFTIAAGEEKGSGREFTEFLREPYPFYGPPKGPYQMFGAYSVPGNPFPLSPFVMTRQQLEMLNAVMSSAISSAKEYKRIVFYDASNPDLARKAKDTPDGFMVPVVGLEKDTGIHEVEFGGVSDQIIKQLAMLHDLADRNTGVFQTMRGEISGETATEISVASENAEEAIAYLRQEFDDYTVNVGESAAWYIWHDDRVEISVGADMQNPMMGGMIDPAYFGGQMSEEHGAFEDLELDIEPFSMPRVNGALARAQYLEMLNVIASIAPLIPQTPWINWKLLTRRGADNMNDPDFDDIINTDVAMMFMGMPGAPLQAPPQQEFSGHGAASERKASKARSSSPAQQGATQGKVSF